MFKIDDNGKEIKIQGYLYDQNYLFFSDMG